MFSFITCGLQSFQQIEIGAITGKMNLEAVWIIIKPFFDDICFDKVGDFAPAVDFLFAECGG